MKKESASLPQTRGQGTFEYDGRPGGTDGFPLERPAPRPLHRKRAQGTFEYIMMLAGALLVISLVTYFLLNNVFAPQSQQLGNQSDQIKDYKKQLQQQTSSQGGGAPASGNPTRPFSDTSTPTPAPSTGLVAHFKLDEKPAQQDSAIADSSPTANHGTLSTGSDGVDKTVQARVGNGFSFDGLNDYVRSPHSASLNFERTQPFTISAWVRTTASRHQIIVAKEENYGNYRGYYMGTYQGRPYLNLEHDDPHFTSVIADNSMNDDRFHHVAVTHDGSAQTSGMKIYIDGQPQTFQVSKDTLQGNTILNTVPLTIGVRDNGGEPFTGIIDDVKIFNRALTPSEVQSLFANP